MNFENFDLSKIDFEKITVDYVFPWGTNLIFAILIFIVAAQFFICKSGF